MESTNNICYNVCYMLYAVCYMFMLYAADACAGSEPEDPVLSVLCQWPPVGGVQPAAPGLRARGGGAVVGTHREQQQPSDLQVPCRPQDGETTSLLDINLT